MTEQKHTCPLCERLKAGDVIVQTELAAAIKDAYPVSPGHTLIVPKRHEPSYFALSAKEATALLELLELAKLILESERQPDGYNIGINEGVAAGQTVFHVHLHLIPRYEGDVPDPRGGIRWIKPERAKYWKR
ncbi:MAG: HIT family protein [Pseudomonadota bacterium]